MKDKSKATTPTNYASFLVRMWHEQSPSGQPESTTDWRSEVEHIQSGQHWTFNTLDELLDFLRQWAQDPDILRPAMGK